MRRTRVAIMAGIALLSAGRATAAPDEPVKKAADPFAFADFTWLNGNSRQTEFPLDTKAFTGEFSFDSNYVYDFAKPKDHTLNGSTNTGRTGEIQVQQLGVGGDLHYQNARGRIFTQFGMYSTMTPRNDASPARGSWNLDNAYRYVSEAYGGYHWDIWNGVNVDAGLFMSYIGLESYYNYENWNYQMSYVSANTPWYFNGVRIQTFPTDKLKIELWLVNGWQSYGMFNEAPGVGWQILYRPSGDWSFVTNEYYGHDTLGTPERMRFHADSSAQFKYLDSADSVLSKAAVSLTIDAGCENGGGVSCLGGTTAKPSQDFFGVMAYNRFWLSQNEFGLTLGGGAISNPGRYLVLVPAASGATASNVAPAAPYTANAGDQFRAWDGSVTFDYMPSQFIAWRLEYIHRQSDTPYFSGPDGSADLRKTENRINAALMVRL